MHLGLSDPTAHNPLSDSLAVLETFQGWELRRCFGAWDTEQLQGFSREQLAELLRRLCPELDEAKRKMVLKHAFTTPKGEMRKVMPYEEFVEKLLRFAAVGERQ
ncbi:unnamed protein product [Durusdinium trenchii]|uniref:Uncharacterized protein n=1 Tax=Durusdinium trenchii TaxID=1381693 RepID=A0ABP0MFI9_9DINO